MQPSARVVWFAVVALVTGLLATALRAERVIGDASQPALVFDVDVPRDALAEMSAAEIERTWRERMREYSVHTSPAGATRPGAVGVRVTVAGADASRREQVSSSLTAGARLELVWVLDGDPANVAWYQAVVAGELSEISPDVEARPDAWRHEDSGREFFDSYLAAPSTAALDRAVAVLSERHPLPPGHVVVYERIEPLSEDDLPAPPRYRTYMVGDELVIANEHIRGAAVTYDPNTLQPEVMLELTAEGAQRFGDATADNVGRKLAILLDGRVTSAPTVQSAIYGGRTNITMGGADPAQMQRDADALVGALGSRLVLPAGFEARLVAAHDRPEALVWALRALAGALGGVLALVTAIVAARRRWFTRAPAISSGPGRWNALAIPALVTFFAPLVLWYAAGAILLPGINEVELMNIIRDPSHAARSQLGIFALGLVPLTSGFVLAELYAILVEALVPARRGRRLGTPLDRRRLDRAAWILVGVLALVQSYFLATYVVSLDSRGVQLITSGGNPTWIILVTLTAGVMVQVFAAETISRHGLCNGYLVLLAFGAAVDLAMLLMPNVDERLLDPDRPRAALFAAIAAVAAAATVVSTRVRTGSDGPRLPYTGVVPASLVRGGLGLFAFAALWSPWVAEHLAKAKPWTPAIELASTVPITALILLSTKRPWTTPGVVATLAFLATLVLLPFTVGEPYRLAAPLAEGVLLGVVGAELWVGALARVRLPDAVTVLVVHDVDRADRAADRLAAAGIPFAVLGVRARAAMRFIGAFAPIALRVPAARADEASATLSPERPAS